MIGQHCLTHSHKLIIGKLISATNWHLVHLFNLQDLGPTLGPKSGRVEIKLYKKKIISSQKIYGLYALKHHIVEMRGDVTDAG